MSYKLENIITGLKLRFFFYEMSLEIYMDEQKFEPLSSKTFNFRNDYSKKIIF